MGVMLQTMVASSAFRCKPFKHQRLKGMSAHQTRQEELARLREREVRKEERL